MVIFPLCHSVHFFFLHDDKNELKSISSFFQALHIFGQNAHTQCNRCCLDGPRRPTNLGVSSQLRREAVIMCELSILRSLLSALSARVRIMTKRERRSARSGGGERRRPSSSNRSNELTASRGRSLRVLELAVDNETFLRSEKHFHKFSGHFTLVT